MFTCAKKVSKPFTAPAAAAAPATMAMAMKESEQRQTKYSNAFERASHKLIFNIIQSPG